MLTCAHVKVLKNKNLHLILLKNLMLIRYDAHKLQLTRVYYYICIIIS
jgi:hypothetical protein